MRRVIEIHDGKAEFYAGNYSFYGGGEGAALRGRSSSSTRRSRPSLSSSKRRRTSCTCGLLWATTSCISGPFSIEKRMERIRTTDKPTKERRLDIKFGRASSGGRGAHHQGAEEVLDGRTLFDHVNLEVIGGERIALLGDNGTGKSTLLKILLGEEEPDSGKLRMGPTVKVGYLPQIIRFSHPERNLVDTMIYDQDCPTQTARNRLAAFNFRGGRFKPVSALSGGERAACACACSWTRRSADPGRAHQPLGRPAGEWIEEAVESYEGNLLFVSHDRYFINRFATRIWMLENGQIIDFRGPLRSTEPPRAETAPGRGPRQGGTGEAEKRRPGGTKELEKQVAAAERAVAKAEERQYELTLRPRRWPPTIWSCRRSMTSRRP